MPEPPPSQDAIGSPAARSPSPEADAAPPDVHAPRWLVILAWSGGPAAVYALLGLAHAALVERSLTVEIGFGRSLAFGVGALYIALPLWGFLPRHPRGWYARRGPLLASGLVGILGLAVCGGFTIAWLAAHWNPAVGIPVTASILALAVAAVVTLWFASRGEPA
jgi:hypothetical protein